MNNPDALPAPGKLNLMLRIVGRRADGYHLLQTVFQFLDYGDEVGLTPRSDRRVRRISSIQGVDHDRDLVVRAARLLQRQFGVRRGVDIHLHKRLPMGAGLGGGSSNAATTLVGLNLLWGLDRSRPELARLGVRLGADVPVFVHGRAAWAEGIGDRFQPLELEQPWYLVVIPPCQVSTAAIFSANELTRDSVRITIADFVGGNHANDCEPVVLRRYPEVARAVEWLRQFGRPRLTGTGACVFVAFDDEHSARRALEAVPRPYSGFVARGLNQSPLSEASLDSGQVGPCC